MQHTTTYSGYIMMKSNSAFISFSEYEILFAGFVTTEMFIGTAARFRVRRLDVLVQFMTTLGMMANVMKWNFLLIQSCEWRMWKVGKSKFVFSPKPHMMSDEGGKMEKNER